MVISGQEDAIAQVVTTLEAQDIECKPLKVSHAFHSPFMDPMVPAFRQVAEVIRYRQPHIALVSNVTGTFAGDEIATADYWCRHLRQAVQFADSMATLSQAGYTHFVEVGPKPILVGMGRHCLKGSDMADDIVWLPSLRPKIEDRQQILQSLATFYVKGIAVDWSQLTPAPEHTKLTLPTYPFQRQHYWVDVQSSANALTDQTAQHKVLHPLLSHKDSLANPQSYFEPLLNAHQPAYLAEHHVLNQTLLPTTSYLERGLTVGHQGFLAPPFTLKQFDIEQGLVLPESSPIQVQTLISPEDSAPIESRTIQSTAIKQVELLETLAAASPEDAQTLLIPYLKERVAQILKLNSAQKIDVDQSFQTLGFDSLMAVEFRSRLRSELDVDIPIQSFIEGASISSLFERLLDQLLLSNLLIAEASSGTNSEEDMEVFTL